MRLRDSILCVSLIGLACCGCANMARTPERNASAKGDASAWQAQWELLASAAESPTWAAEHEQILAALEHAAAMRDAAAPPTDPATSRAGSVPSDNTAPTLGRAADALAELANKIAER